MARVLIAGTAYIDTQPKRHLADLWAKTMVALNPDATVFIVDSASPMDLVRRRDDIYVMRQPENVGHLSKGGMDGWGQAFCQSIIYATDIYAPFDYVLLTECDILFSRPVAPIFDRMAAATVKFATPMDMTWQFIENGLCFASVPYLRDSGFAAKYDWPNSTLAELPERKVERIAGADLFTLPLRGCRNDHDRVTAENIGGAFPYGCDYITHCRDFAVYRAFLRMNGLPDE